MCLSYRIPAGKSCKFFCEDESVLRYPLFYEFAGKLIPDSASLWKDLRETFILCAMRAGCVCGDWVRPLTYAQKNTPNAQTKHFGVIIILIIILIMGDKSLWSGLAYGAVMSP